MLNLSDYTRLMQFNTPSFFDTPSYAIRVCLGSELTVSWLTRRYEVCATLDRDEVEGFEVSSGGQSMPSTRMSTRVRARSCRGLGGGFVKYSLQGHWLVPVGVRISRL